VFPNGKGEFSAGWRSAAHKTEGRAGGLDKKEVCRAAEKEALRPVLFRSPA